MLWLLQLYGVSRSHSTSRPFSEHYRQADLYMLALRVVTARVHVVINGSLRPQFTISRDVENQVFFYTKHTHTWPGPGLELRTLSRKADVLYHYTTAPLVIVYHENTW